MKIVVDENIPFAQALLAQHGEVIRVDGRKLQADQLKGVDALLIRSITKVNEALLSEADQLKFVGTATIGTEHVDQELLAARGIDFSSAPGCNAISVGQYVATALLADAKVQRTTLAGKSIAIVGAGNTGRQSAKVAAALGMNVMLYDPPLAEQGLLEQSVSFDEVLKADVISLHVPMNKSGKHPTHHLFNAEVLKQLNTEQILVNACRGAVIDNHALLAQAQANLAPRIILDVWEFEPKVITELVPYAFIATPHIAGYSLEGKMRGTSMIYQAMCQSLGLVCQDHSAQLLPDVALDSVNLVDAPNQDDVARLTNFVYDIYADDRRFRSGGLDPLGFDQLRKTYPERREFNTLAIRGCYNENLQQLGFSIES